MPKIPDDEMVYVQQMLAQLQKSQAAQKAQASAAEQEEQQPPVGVGAEWALACRRPASGRAGEGGRLPSAATNDAALVGRFPASGLHCAGPTAERFSAVVSAAASQVQIDEWILQFVDLLKEHCGIDPDKPLECQEVRCVCVCVCMGAGRG